MEDRVKIILAAFRYYRIPMSYQITPSFDIILYDSAELLCHTHDTEEGHQWESVRIDFKSLWLREIGKIKTVRFWKGKLRNLSIS